MIRRLNSFASLALLSLGLAGTLSAQTVPPTGADQEAKFIAVLKSNAPLKEKADACRGLSLIGTKESVAPLAALLGDEKVSHLARYGLEPIPDPAVDEALRDALGNLKGRPLIGVIGSLGVRRDTKAVSPLSGLLKDADADTAHAAARALGRIGNQAAADALEGALESAPAANRLAISEGLFRCADHLVAGGKLPVALEIYDKLNRPDAPPQVKESAMRKARFFRLNPGPTL